MLPCMYYAPLQLAKVVPVSGLPQKGQQQDGSATSDLEARYENIQACVSVYMYMYHIHFVSA